MIIYGIVLNYREVPLKKIMFEKKYKELKNVSIVIERNSYKLSLYSDTTHIKTYKVVFGNNFHPRKIAVDSRATPIGKYKIDTIFNNYKYHKLLRINYPNKYDLAEALKNGDITENQYNKIKGKNKLKNIINIGIHGIGEYNIIFKNLPFVFNWTNGSAALSNENIDELYSVIKIGTPVIIKK